jgi:nitroreductase
MLKLPHAVFLLLNFIMLGRAEEFNSISLPPPKTSGGRPLMDCLSLRRSVREFAPDTLPLQVLGDVLWAGFGINRPIEGRRTAPSAMNSQEVEIYVALPQALYLYDAKQHQLLPVLKEDLRARTGQSFSKDAPVVLIYAANLDRLEKAKPEMKTYYAAIDGGAICQNVYLCCASEGLATCVYDLDREAVSKAMGLKEGQHVVLAQAVGYPAKKQESK